MFSHVAVFNMEAWQSNPYRYSEPVDFKGRVYAEMAEACVYLKKLKRFKPAIAGGALWSWAAQKPARDIDIFMKNSWFARRKVRRITTLSFDEMWPNGYHSDGYGSWLAWARIDRYTYRSKLDIDFDFVLTPWHGVGAARKFDYGHVQVAFAPEVSLDLGAVFYQTGELHKNNDRDGHERPKELIESKIQRSLWKNADAGLFLMDVFHNLSYIYNRL